jgi:phenylacetic acid degradation operon negative regulatory protein
VAVSISDLASEYNRADRLQTAAPSARSLLLTVLGTFVLPTGGAAWTTSLVASLGLVSVNDGNARQAISRASQAGWLVSHKHGRRARWQLTGRAEELLSRGAERIYPFGQGAIDWAGRWLVVLASVPESQRDARYRLRVQLGWAGFGSLGPGIWVSPWPQREAEALEVIDALGVSLPARSFLARHGEIGDQSTIVDEAWDLATLADGYEAFIDEFASIEPATPAETAGSLLRLVHSWRRFPAVDPVLPSELLPADWPGTEAATIFAAQRQRWLGPANRWWEKQERANSR